MKKQIIILICCLFPLSRVFSSDVAYDNPLFLDIESQANNNDCVWINPIWNDEADSDVNDEVTARYFCDVLWYSFVSYEIDDSPSDSLVCEANSNTNPTQWRTDSSSTDIFTQIVCDDWIQTSGCTYPNAQNYDPMADSNDGSCIYITNWETTWTGFIDEWINKDILSIEDVNNLQELEWLIMVLILFWRFFERVLGRKIIRRKKSIFNFL